MFESNFQLPAIALVLYDINFHFPIRELFIFHYCMDIKSTIEKYIGNNVCTWVVDCFGAHGRVIVVLISRVAKERENKHQNKTRVSAAIVRHESTYIILFLAQHNESINDGKNDDFYTSSPCLARFS